MEVLEGRAGDPVLDTAISHAVLRQVARGDRPESIRVHRAARTIAFGLRDTKAPGYRAAVEASRRAGFEPIERLAGGRAAAFTELTLAFSWARPEDGSTVESRFREIAEIMRDAFVGLGADAHIGEVPGEYCPGAYSVNLSRRHKVMGVGQRLISGGAHLGGVVVVGGAHLIAGALDPIYRSLGLRWDRSTAGDLRMQARGVSVSATRKAILEQFAARRSVSVRTLDADLLAEAQMLAQRHLSRPPDW